MKTSFATTASLSAALAVLLMTGCATKSPQPETTAVAAPPPVQESASKKAEENKVKGINGREGEIIGKPAANSKFRTLQIGMSMRQATDLAGQPTDEGAYITGKAFIPFYFGGDRHRIELAYKGQGRLIFAGESPWSRGGYTSGHLIKIIHDPRDSGYR
jgi:hypothetical protein